MKLSFLWIPIPYFSFFLNFELLPFSLAELQQSQLLPELLEDLLLTGFYPPVYDQHIPAPEWVPNYIRTYIERDVRQIKNIQSLLIFERFMRILAGRCAQELNYAAIALEVGVDIKTIQTWIGILESSFIIFLLRPYYKNFNKTLVKRPKLYFYDSSLVCSLLSIVNSTQLTHHPVKGPLFESMVVAELLKIKKNLGSENNLYYWREKSGVEIDILLDSSSGIIPVEIKSGMTIQKEFFKNINRFRSLHPLHQSFVLYNGDEEQKRSDGIQVTNWKNINSIKAFQ